MTAGGDEKYDLEDDEPLDTERLALDDRDEPLPWLETDDDLDEDEGPDASRILLLATVALFALVVVAGGLWWFNNRQPDPAFAGNGGVIEAPATPYKEAPKDPGGKTFDGTGDSSFAVSEGQSRPAKLGEGGDIEPAPPPPPVTKTPSAATPAAKPAAATPPATGGVGVQVGAFSSRAAAEAAWTRLSAQSSALSGSSHRIVEGKADIGTVYRLQAVAGDTAAANALCSKLKGAGISCQVK